MLFFYFNWILIVQVNLKENTSVVEMEKEVFSNTLSKNVYRYHHCQQGSITIGQKIFNGMKIWKNDGITLANGFPAELNKSVLFQVPFAKVSNFLINFLKLSIV